jgi:hypothetical protein
MSTTDAAAEQVTAPQVTRIVSTTLLVSPVRLALSGVGLVVATVVGAPAGSALLAFATAAAGMALVVLNDPRRRLFERGPAEPLPTTALELTRLQSVGRALYPSSLGLVVLVAIAMGLGRGTLGALLSGLLAGLGLASLVVGIDLMRRERRSGREYYAGQHGRVFARERA